MTAKTQAIVTAIAGGISGYIAYFIALPQNLQTGILGEIINLLPASAQPAAGSTAKTLSTLLAIYATYKAAHSGPQTPPVDKPRVISDIVPPMPEEPAVPAGPAPGVYERPDSQGPANP